MLSITKLQNLKAIHNSFILAKKPCSVVINHKTTKFESNSQPSIILKALSTGCYQSQNYKIWKQFTTSNASDKIDCKLLSITKLQNLKAIHNFIGTHPNISVVVINHKTTKFESNSQLEFLTKKTCLSCYQSQNYKIWKQFTTITTNSANKPALLSITKLQNLKAIHNLCSLRI